MGVDIMFKMRHNLDASSVDVLASELQTKLGLTVKGFLNPADIENFEQLGLPIPVYDAIDESTNIYIEDEYVLARVLIETYGEGARNRIANCPDLQCVINQIDDVNQGLYSYTINHDTFTDFGMPNIWRITNDTISGTPGFGNDRWYQFSKALDHNSRYNNVYLSDLIESRKQLYEFLKPLLVDEYLYYHADQGSEEELSWMCYFDDIPNFLAKINLEIFDLSEYIQNIESRQIYNNQNIEYIIRDDFKDFR